jgi:hypothetical protein
VRQHCFRGENAASRSRRATRQTEIGIRRQSGADQKQKFMSVAVTDAWECRC